MMRAMPSPSLPRRRSANTRTVLAIFLRAAAVAAVLLPPAAFGEPIRLKLSYFGPEQALIYQAGIKPFVDAVNVEGKGLLNIEVYANGTLGGTLGDQPALVQKGVVDIAWVVPGQTPYRFLDNRIFELPGMFRDAREGTLAYTRLVAAHALRGYEDFFVIGAYTTAPNAFHGRKPIGSLAALRGLKIRTNNATEADVLTRLNAIPTVLPVVQVGPALERGTIDAAVVGLSGFFDYGISNVATYHFLMPVGAAPVALLMNRKKFDSLPDAAKSLIRKYSGEWAANNWTENISRFDAASLDKLRSDPKHTIVNPSTADLEAAESVYRSIIDNWVVAGDRNRPLLGRLEAELAAIRSARRQ